VGTPSYGMYIAEAAPELGYRLEDLRLRLGLFGSEPWTDQLRDELERRTGITALDNYGLSEVIGPGVSFECAMKDGLHINEDHFLCEVVDPVTGEAVPDGREGELVFTSLTKEAVPVVRYRSGDLASMNREPCSCGRVFARHSKVFARADDMLVVRGMNVYPSQVEAVLMSIEQIEPHYQIILYREGPLDQMEVHVEVSPGRYAEALNRRESFQGYVEECLRHELGIRPRVRLVEPKTVQRHTGKAQRVVDNRGMAPGER
jgi:phenylacetate-CoA ligase